MDHVHKLAIQQNTRFFRQNFSATTEIIDYLYEKNVISEDQHGQLLKDLETQIPSTVGMELVNIIKRGGPLSYKTFIDALGDGEGAQSFVAERLEKTVSDLQDCDFTDAAPMSGTMDSYTPCGLPEGAEACGQSDINSVMQRRGIVINQVRGGGNASSNSGINIKGGIFVHTNKDRTVPSNIVINDVRGGNATISIGGGIHVGSSGDFDESAKYSQRNWIEEKPMDDK